MKSALILVVPLFLFISSCREDEVEIVFPGGENGLPGTYKGSIHITGSNETIDEVNAIVKFVEKNLYTIEIQGADLLNLPVFEIEIYDVASDYWIRYKVLNEGWGGWGLTPNQFIMHPNSPIDFTFRVVPVKNYKSLMIQFDGGKWLAFNSYPNQKKIAPCKR